MSKIRWNQIQNKIPVFLIFFILLLVISVCFLIYNDNQNIQSSSPVPPDVIFVGEYKVGEGEWREYDGKHIPIKRGKDVTLNGYFVLLDPTTNEPYPVSEGLMIAFYLNHINVKLYNPNGTKVELFCEVKAAGESSCGETWQYYTVTTEAYEPITIVISNPHSYGNSNAVDDMLETMSLYYHINFELMKLRESRFEITIASLVMFFGVSIILVGLFSCLLKIKRIKSIFSVGLCVFFAGAYLFFSTRSIFLYFEKIYNNTIIVELLGMFYYFFIMKSFNDLLCEEKKMLGNISVINSGLIIPISIFLTLFTNLYFFDMWLLFAIFEGISFVLLSICIVFNFKKFTLFKKIFLLIFIMSFISYILDTLFSYIGGFEETGFSKISFVIIFLISMITFLTLVPKNINNSIINKQLENEKIILNNELQENKILLMISQIQPHFLYNMLNTIYHLCDKDVSLAKKSIDVFSTYLRNNIDSLNSQELIYFDKEIENIMTYTELEKIRFGDELEIDYCIETSDFYLPILSIQPIVENAIKHGVSKKRGGGKVTISSCEDEFNYIITILDTGVGFDINQTINDGKTHIGIKNVKERLQKKVNGTLIIESEIGVGTKAVVYIPKKEKK